MAALARVHVPAMLDPQVVPSIPGTLRFLGHAWSKLAGLYSCMYRSGIIFLSPALLVMEYQLLNLRSIVLFSLVGLYFLLLLPFPIISCLPSVSLHGGFNFTGFCWGKYFIFLFMLLSTMF